MNRTKIWCDGSTTNVCFIIEGQEPVIVPAIAPDVKVTNNEGEYYAICRALEEAAVQGIPRVVVYSDSQLVVNQLNGDYKTKKKSLETLRNIVLWMVSWFESVEFQWIERETNKAGVVLDRQ